MILSHRTAVRIRVGMLKKPEVIASGFLRGGGGIGLLLVAGVV